MQYQHTMQQLQSMSSAQPHMQYQGAPYQGFELPNLTAQQQQELQQQQQEMQRLAYEAEVRRHLNIKLAEQRQQQQQQQQEQQQTQGMDMQQQQQQLEQYPMLRGSVSATVLCQDWQSAVSHGMTRPVASTNDMLSQGAFSHASWVQQQVALIGLSMTQQQLL